MSNIPIVPMVLLGTLTTKITDFLKYLRNWKDVSSRNAAITQLIAWVVGVGGMFGLTQSNIAGGIVFGNQTLSGLNVFTKVLIGLAGTSLLSTVYDFKKAIDSSDSAATPALVGPAVSRLTRHGALRKYTPINPAPFDPTGGSTVPPGGTTPYGQATDPGHVVVLGGSTTYQPAFVPGNVEPYAPTAYPPLPSPGSVVAPGGSVGQQQGKYPTPNAEPYAPSAQPQAPWSPPGGTGGTAGGYTLSGPQPSPDAPSNEGSAVPAARQRPIKATRIPAKPAKKPAVKKPAPTKAPKAATHKPKPRQPKQPVSESPKAPAKPRVKPKPVSEQSELDKVRAELTKAQEDLARIQPVAQPPQSETPSATVDDNAPVVHTL